MRTREEASTTLARARALATALPPRAFFVGTTAAVILGAPLPTLRDERIQAAVPHGLHPPQRAGVRGRRLRVEEDAIVTVDGVRVTTPVRTWCDLATDDLMLRGSRVLIEYLGDYHRVEKGRWRKDRVRCGRFRAAGWTVIELVADHLLDLPAVVDEVRAAAIRGSDPTF